MPVGVGRRQFTMVLDEEDLTELEEIAKERRASLAQVVREFIVAGIKRQRQIAAAEVA